MRTAVYHTGALNAPVTTLDVTGTQEGTSPLEDFTIMNSIDRAFMLMSVIHLGVLLAIVTGLDASGMIEELYTTTRP